MFKKIILFIFFFFSYTGLACAFDNPGQGVNTINEVFEYVYNHHISRPDVNILTEGAIKGLLDTLNDPYTEYFSPETLNEFTSSLDGNFTGVGIELESQVQYPVIVKVINNSPAKKAGLKPGDLIIRVNGEDIARQSLPEIVEKIRGPVGTVVKLTIKRLKKDVKVQIKRELIKLPSCEWRVLSDNIGYICIHNFGASTSEEFQSALESLKERQVKGLVLDLRNDPGGYLQAAVEIAGYFLPAGELVVTTVDRDGKTEEYRTTGSKDKWDLPLAVLINGFSASAAEVLAGALADYKVATLVGTRSYGKGVVQALVPLEMGGALKVTVARYLTPKGSFIDKNGLVPDRIVSTPQLQVYIAKQVITKKTIKEIVYTLNSDTVLLDGEEVRHLPPISLRGKIYLPMRFTMEAFGYEVKWEEYRKQALIKGKGKELLFMLNGGNTLFNDYFVKVDHPVIIHEGKAYLAEEIFKLLGVQIHYKDAYIILKRNF